MQAMGRWWYADCGFRGDFWGVEDVFPPTGNLKKMEELIVGQVLGWVPA
jgi:hypothetical protein